MSQLFFLKHNTDYVIILRSTTLYTAIKDDVFMYIGSDYRMKRWHIFWYMMNRKDELIKSIYFASTDLGPIEQSVYKVSKSTEHVGQGMDVVESLRDHRIVVNARRMVSDPIFPSRDKIGSVLWIIMRLSHLSESLTERKHRVRLRRLAKRTQLHLLVNGVIEVFQSDNCPYVYLVQTAATL